MAQYVNGVQMDISDAAVKIVEKFCEKTEKKISGDDRILTLLVSLNAIRQGVNETSIGDLRGFYIDLTNILTQKEIDILMREHKSVAHYCYYVLSPNMVFLLNGDKTRIVWEFFSLCETIINPKKCCEILLPYAGDAHIVEDQTDIIIRYGERKEGKGNSGKEQRVYDIIRYGERKERKGRKYSFDCYEPDFKVWAFSQVVGDKHFGNLKIKPGSPLKDNGGKLYDYVFTCPIYGHNSQDVVDYLYDIAEKRLKNHGVMCCLLPDGFCSSPEWYGLRKILLDKNGPYSATLILLPGTFLIQSEYLCAFILYKNNRDDIILMDAVDEGFHRSWGYEYTFYDYAIVNELRRRNKKYVWTGSKEDLVGELDLFPAEYLFKQYVPDMAEDNTICRLEDVIELVHNPSSLDRDGWFYIDEAPLELGVSELSANYLNCNIFYKDIPHIGRRRSLATRGGIISTRCLLVGNINGTLRVGKAIDFSPTNPVKLMNGVIPFNIKSDSCVIEDFLLRSVMSDDFAEQAKILRGRMSGDLFLQFKIVLPSKEEQERLCREDVQKMLKATNQKVSDDLEDFQRNIRAQRHKIGQTISALYNWWILLQRARSENRGTLSDNTMVGNRKKTTVGEIYDGLQDALLRLQKQIDMFDRGADMDMKVEEFAITDFVEEYIKTHRSPLFDYEYNRKEYRFSQKFVDGGQDNFNTVEYVRFSRKALEIVFDNIISNACSHGFAENSVGNKIRIDIAWVGGYVVVTVSNNGEPIHKGISSSDVFTYGKSSKKDNEHLGFGGYEIKRLMREFRGDAEIISTPSREYTVSYKLTFPTTWMETGWVGVGFSKQSDT